MIRTTSGESVEKVAFTMIGTALDLFVALTEKRGDVSVKARTMLRGLAEALIEYCDESDAAEKASS